MPLACTAGSEGEGDGEGGSEGGGEVGMYGL